MQSYWEERSIYNCEYKQIFKMENRTVLVCCWDTHRCEPVPALLEVGVFSFIFAL